MYEIRYERKNRPRLNISCDLKSLYVVYVICTFPPVSLPQIRENVSDRYRTPRDSTIRRFAVCGSGALNRPRAENSNE